MYACRKSKLTRYLSVLLFILPSLGASQCLITNLNSVYCTNSSSVSLAGGTAYFGPGVSGGVFNPMTAGPGTHKIFTTDGSTSLYTVSTAGAFAPTVLSSPTDVVLADNTSQQIALGFNFNFFDNVYNSLYIHDDGYLSFSGDIDAVPQILPDASTPNNLIAFAWTDLNPVTGTIRYQVLGSAPLRKLVVEFSNIAIIGGADDVDVQVHLYETSNLIEIHSSHNGSVGTNKTMGIENGTGTSAHVVTGRNNSVWTADNDYVAFIPSCTDVRTVLVNATPADLSLSPLTPAICSGESVAVTISSSQAGANYQLLNQADDTPLSSVVPGTGGNLIITSVPLSANTAIKVEAENVSTTCSIYLSNLVSVSVNVPPSIVTPPSSLSLCEGTAATFAVTASGTSLTYQWQEDQGSGFNNITNGGIYSGATSDELLISPVSSALNTYQYRVVVAGSCTPPQTSAPGTLTINELPEVTAHPSSASICSGGNTAFTVSAGTTTGATYQWEVSTNGGVSYSIVVDDARHDNVNTATLNLVNIPLGFNGRLYRARIAGSCSPPAFSNAALLTVAGAPTIVAQPANVTTCENSGAIYMVVASGASLTYQWQEDQGSGFNNLVNGGIYSGATSSSLSISSVLSAMHTYRYRVIVSGTCTPSATSAAALLNVREQPEITLQPLPSTICSGAATSFSINAGVTTSPVYLWQISTDGGLTFTAVVDDAEHDNVNTATLSLVNVPAGFNNRLYRAVVAGTCTPPVVSTPALLTVQQAPTISTNPINVVSCEGSSSSFSVTATGTALSYQWQEDQGSGFTNLIDGGIYSGTTTSMLAISAVGSAMNAYRYRVVVSGACVPPQTSGFATLTVNELPEITSHPASTATCSGGNVSFSVNAGATTSPLYQWEVSTNGGLSYSNVTDDAEHDNVTSATLNITGVPSTFNNRLYRVAVNGACSPSVRSNSALLTVNVAVTIQVQTAGQDICAGSTAQYTVSATGSGLSYQWQQDQGSGFNNISDGPVFSGTATSQLTLTNVPFAYNGRTYRVIITGTCGPLNSNSAPLSVKRIPDAFASNSVICSGSATTIAITNPNAVPGTTFNYTVQSASNVTGATSGTGATISQTLTVTNGISPGTVTYLVVPSASGCTGSPYAVVVDVRPIPNAAASNAVICSGATTNISISNPNGVAGTSFSWSVFSVSNVSGASAGTGSLIAQSLSASDGVNPGSVTYSITPTANGCAGTPVNVVVTVNPTPLITDLPSALLNDICSGVALNFLPTSHIPSTFSWTSQVLVGTVSGVPASGTGAINHTPSNATNSVAQVVYTITPTAGACAGPTANYIVNVKPRPTVAASPTVICSGNPAGVLISNPNNVAGTSFSWTVVSNPNVSGASSGSGNRIDQVLTNVNGTSNGTVTYSVVATADGCSGTPTNVVVTVRPVPVITNPPPAFAQQQCSSVPVNFVSTSSIGGTTFAWTSSGSAQIDPASIGSGTGTINNSPINISNVAGTVTYTIVPTFNTCAGAPRNLVVTVLPAPSATALSATICSGQTTAIGISPAPKNVSGTTFAWTASPSANVVGATNGSGSAINQALSTTNSVVGTVDYTVIPSANSCSGPAVIVTVVVNPAASVIAPVDEVLCEPTSIPLTGTMGGSATSATWTLISGGGTLSGSTIAGSNVSATYTPVPADVQNTVRFRITTNDPDGAGPCLSIFDDYLVTLNRKALVTVPANYTICEPASLLLSGNIGGSASSAAWSIITGSGGLSATSLTGPTATASYSPAAADVNTTVRFRLTATDPDGSGPCAQEFADLQITINRAAQVSAGGDDEICEYESVNLSGSFGGAASAVTWSGGGGAPQFGNVNSPVTTYSITPADIAAGSVTLTLTTNDPDGAGPCTAANDQILVRINRRPAIFFSGLEPFYAENSPVDFLDGFPTGGVFTGPGIVAGTNQFNPGNAPLGLNTITFTYTHPVTTCTNSTSRNTVINPVTSVDFDIEPVRRDVNGWPIVCANSGNLRILGYPPVSDGFPTTVFKSNDIPTRILFDGTDYYLNTDNLLAGVYQLQYIFTNSVGATDTLTKEVTVYAAPLAVINAENICKGVPYQFTESSSIPNNFSGATISEYFWDLEENGEQSSLQNPVYTFTQVGNKQITLTVTTDQLCSNTAVKTVRVGELPSLNFNWTNICGGVEFTAFQDLTVTTPFSQIVHYQWDFGDGFQVGNTVENVNDPIPAGTHGGLTKGTFKNPEHNYDMFQTYDVTMEVATFEGCTGSLTRKVFILEYANVDPASGYFTDFESGPGTWVALSSAGSDTSWVFGSPAGSIIDHAKSGTQAWWTGGNENAATDFGTYHHNEISEVIGPCINLSGIKRPMISLNYWSDTQNGFDGAVVQYSVNGGADWVTIGDANPNRGIEWYGTRDLASEPGGQDNYAWSGSSGGWKNARFNLDQIPEDKRSSVLFQIAFASNDDNPKDRVYEGFAFDDIYIGEKKRNVLVEHFTNDNDITGNQADNYLKNLYEESYQLKDSSDFVLIQYHLGNPSPDQIYQGNPQDPTIRSLVFGVSQPPTSIMDGIQGTYFNNEFDGAYTDVNPFSVDRRALQDPAFDIKVTFNNSGPTEISATAELTYIDPVQTLGVPVTFQLALVERDVNNNLFVLRKLLLQSGRAFTRSWQNGDKEIIEIVSELNVPVSNPANLYVVGFVQLQEDAPNLGEPAKRILQSILLKAPEKEGRVLVGIEDDPVVAGIRDLQIYPNPSAGDLYLQSDIDLPYNYTYYIVDQRGITLMQGDIPREMATPRRIDIHALPSGIYFLAIRTADREVMYKKIAVVK